MMQRYLPILFVCGCLWAPCAWAQNTNNQPPPNIILLLADDLGYGDLSCYGSTAVETPALDALAQEGTRFSRFYAASAVCTPSRACIMTGKFPLRYDIRAHFTDHQQHLPTAAVTLPELLQKAGYRTAHVGKWHLGGLRPRDYEARHAGRKANPGPLQHGFEHSLTNIEDPNIRRQLVLTRQLYRGGGKHLVRNDQKAPESSKHWTEIKVDEAIGLVDQYAEGASPFFINLWFDVPHKPYEPAPEPHLSKYKKLGATGDQLYFRSMVSYLDANIGRLVDHLKAKGIFENTIILFTSDNGPAFQGSPGPFRGGKTDLHEGGIRVPTIMVWPGHIPANAHTFTTMHMADILPTLSEVAGINTEHLPLDGKSMLAELTTPSYSERKTLLWQLDLYEAFQNQGPKPTPYATSVVMQGKWKMLADSLRPTELFDLEQDHRELYNLLGEYPEIEKELTEELRQFMADERDQTGFVEEGE